MNSLIFASDFDPWRNLALEELLFTRKNDDDMTLYIWQNSNAVVIGRNQNAWCECCVELLQKDGGKLARRTSGGGAVYHDLGNLNFTFIAKKRAYDVKRQLSVLISAMRELGINAYLNGRNDVVTEKGKFSGNAFRHSHDISLHHGTILVNTDAGKMLRYLTPSKSKLEAKGVDSVRSRISNLSDLIPKLSIADVKSALITAFEKEYGEYTVHDQALFHGSELDKLTEKNASWEWRLGAAPKFDVQLSNRFSWGGIDLYLSFENGMIKQAQVYSDALDESFIRKIPLALTGCRFDYEEMSTWISALDCAAADELSSWLLNQA